MLTAVLWSALATVTLLIGMALAYRNLIGPRWTALFMAFGGGRHHQRRRLPACPGGGGRGKWILYCRGPGDRRRSADFLFC